MESGANPGGFRDEAALIDHLRAADAPCYGCGYNMRGLGGLTCPECGRRFRMWDLARSPRAGWVSFLLGGWGWWLCVGAGVGATVWEAVVESHAPMWYRDWVQGRNGFGLVTATVAILLPAWPIVRYMSRERVMAEPLLGVAWGAVAVHLAALVWVSVT